MQSASCSFAQGEHSHSIAARRPVARPHDLCEIAQGCNRANEARVVGSGVSKNNETDPSLELEGEVFETVAPVAVHWLKVIPSTTIALTAFDD